VGMFLPTVVSSIIAIAVRIINTNAKVFQPWNALAHSRGAQGRDSLYLPTSGWKCTVRSVRCWPIMRGQAVVLLTTLLSVISQVLIPLSAEAVALDLRGAGCVRGANSARNCAWVLSKSTGGTVATITLLVIMILATTGLIVLLARWRLGVKTNPWSICAMATLSVNSEVREIARSTAVVKGTDTNHNKDCSAKQKIFMLEQFRSSGGSVEYGIVVLDDAQCQKGVNEFAPGSYPHYGIDHHSSPKRKHHVPFFMLSIFGRACLLSILCGVLVLILYYSRTGGDTGFENFIDSDSFGVRFLFTAFGVIISSAWSSLFDCKSPRSCLQLPSPDPSREGRRNLVEQDGGTC
jgi:hypothetical protein